MAEGPDYPGLIAGHADVIDRINAGDAGLPALHHLLQVAQQALRAEGMSFAEYGPRGGRVIAATGKADWALGRPVDPHHPAVDRLLSGPRSWNIPVETMEGGIAHQLQGRGLFRALGARAEVGGHVVGSLQAYFADADGPAGRAEHTLIAYLASCAAHMYGDQTGLPVHGDGPVVAALADGLAIIDRQGTVRLWNPAAERVLGRRAAKMLGRPLPLPIPPSGQVIDHPLPDGRWLKITAGDLPGSPDSRVVTFRDATEQHRIDHDRDLFVAVTSHELRTPVTVIKGYADTLANHWDNLADTDRREAVRVIGQRAGELAKLVDRLLSTAGESGPVGGSPPVPFDLAEGLRSAVATLPSHLRRRLVLDVPDDLPKALGDRAILPTVITELATNADKYSHLDSPIDLTAGADERTAFFRVSDRGIGVRPEHVERAFERFWQGESGDRRRYPGAGLGLYLVRRIIERQNGWVFLRPSEGGGTVAEVRLPRGDG